MSVTSYINHLLFRPPKPIPTYLEICSERENVAYVTETCQEIYVKTKIPSVCCEHPSPRMVVVYSHGNSENILTCRWFLEEISRVFQADAYAFEYAGYFQHSDDSRPPAPSEAGCFDASSVFVGQLARLERDRRNLPVVLLGYSLGCAIALHAADAHRRDDFPAAVLLMAPFVSAASVVLAPRSWLLNFTSVYAPFDVFVMRTAALRSGHALFVAHGSADEVIPCAHGRCIAELAAQHAPKDVAFLMVPDATHASLRLHQEVYEQFLIFLWNRLKQKRDEELK